MTQTSQIRSSTPDDFQNILTIYPLAFPDEELRPLVTDLLTTVSDRLSLVAERDGEIIGHAIFTSGWIEGSDAKLGLLGPLTVTPKAQKQGIGTRLIDEGRTVLSAAGFAKILLLGDPEYYARHGFVQETDIDAPYDMPDSWKYAWQGYALNEGPAAKGRLVLPDAWMKPEYWMPTSPDQGA